MTLLWQTFIQNFRQIINDIDDYKKIFDFAVNYNNNLLFFSYKGFPFDLFIDAIIKEKFKISHIYRNELCWNKTIVFCNS